MTSSTSESSLLLAGLDLARRDLVTRTDRITDSIAAVDRVRDVLRADSRFAIATDDIGDDSAVHGIDPLRLVVDTRGTGLTGHEARQRLFHDHGVHVEMSTDAVVVALVGAGSRIDEYALIRAFTSLPHGIARDVVVHALPRPGERVLDLRTAAFAVTDVVSAGEAIGRISADSLAAYPPGVPNVLPGELITADVVDFLTASAKAPHGYVRGAIDPDMKLLRVVRT